MTDLAVSLVKKLGKGRVAFTYRKKNGEIRNAIGTTNRDILAEYIELSDNHTSKKGRNVITYYDLNSKGWRALKPENLIKVEVVMMHCKDYGTTVTYENWGEFSDKVCERYDKEMERCRKTQIEVDGREDNGLEFEDEDFELYEFYEFANEVDDDDYFKKWILK